MNDKWFNIGMIIILTSLVANGFVFMLTSFPGGNAFTGFYDSDLSYTNINTDLNVSVNEGANINNTATNYDGSGFIPILIGGIAAGLASVTLIIMAVAGLELLLLNLAGIFTMFSPLLYMIVAVMIVVKAIVIAYLGSALIRLIFGGRS